MSGDVQPRKRKDKKKKRDDDEPKEKSAPVHAKMGPDDIQLHVHSDHGTGGHWCAKILFFSLMAVLVGLIGLILLETRGVSDLDTPLSESRFADYLEGWVDEKRESHDDHDVLEALQDELDEHGDEPFEEEEAGHDDDDDDHDQEHDNDSNEEEDDEVDGNHDEDDAQENDNDNTNDDDDDDDTPREENDLNDEDDDSRQEESDNRNEEDVSKEENDNGNENDDEDDDSAGDFSENGGNEDADDNEIENDDNDDTDEGFEDQLGDDSIDADDNRPFEEEDDSDDASNEQFIDNDQGEDLHLQKLTEKEAAEQQNEEDEQDTSSSQVKRSGAQQDDDEFEDELRRTNEMLYDNPTSALKSFDVLIEIKPNSSQAWYGKGRALDQLSDEQKSNEILKEAIAAYVKAVEFGSSVDDETFKIYAERCIDRMRFIAFKGCSSP